MAAFVSKNAGPEAAVIAGRNSEMDRAANVLLRAVRTRAMAHVRTGNYIKNLSIQTVPSLQPSRVGYVQDRIVVADDKAALSIEYGHWNTRITRNGRRVSTGVLRKVPGQYIMTGALGMVR